MIETLIGHSMILAIIEYMVRVQVSEDVTDKAIAPRLKNLSYS
jgi:hypothetical protein